MATKVEYKDSPFPKITIAKDELRVKIPKTFEPAIAQRFIAFCEYVDAQVRPLWKQTLRGKITMTLENNLCVDLHHDNNALIFYCEEGGKLFRFPGK